MSGWSLQWRVSVLVSILVTVAVAAICVVAYHEMSESWFRNVEKVLRAEASGVLAALDNGDEADRLARAVSSILETTQGKRPSLFRVWIEGSSRDLLASDPPDSERGRWLRSVPPPDGPGPISSRAWDTGEHRMEYRALWLRRPLASGEVANVIIAESSHYLLHELEEFRNILLIVGGVTLAVVVVMLAGTIRWGLRPIRRVAERLRTVTARDLHGGGVGDVKAPVELRPFVASTQAMLDRLAEAFEREKGFTANASHELRTPLSVLKSSLQAAEMAAGSPQRLRQAVREALEDVDRMERLIEQLLVLARLDRPHESEAPEEMDLTELLAGIVEVYDARAARSGGTVVLTADSPVRVRGRREELERLFGNLIDNGVKYGPEGGTVSVGLDADGGGDVNVRIHDDGGDIPAEALPHLFDRFYRVDTSRSRDNGGAGLGLAIAMGIARRHGGDISIDSTPAAGTCVTVRLPAAPPKGA